MKGITLHNGGAYYIGGRQWIADSGEAAAMSGVAGLSITRDEARRQTMAYQILSAHNTSDSDQNLRIRFDKLTSHDITYVGIIQTARASGLTRFPP